MSTDSVSDDRSDLLDIRFLLWLWLRWSWLFVLFGLAGAYFGVREADRFVPTYEASMVVMPDSGSVQISQTASQFTSALGISVGGSVQSSTFDRLKVMVGSVALAEELQERYGLLQIVYAGSWDEQNGTWIEPDPEAYRDRYRFRQWFDLRIPEWREPDLEALARFLEGTVVFKQESGTQFFEVSVMHPDPELALFLLTSVYNAADEALRAQDREESRERRRYIQRQLSQANLVDARQSLIGLLTGEERRAILLESNLPYAARIIEPPFVSNRPADLNLMRTISVPAALGALLGLVLVTLVGLLRKN